MDKNHTALPSLSWTNIITGILVIFTAAGGAYALVQQQFSALEHQFNKEMEFSRNTIESLKDEVETMRLKSVFRPEHTEMVKRLDEITAIVREQIRIIETTRPTTGELQAIGVSTARQMEELKDRVRSIEEYMRRPQQLAPVNPAIGTHNN